MTLERKIAKAFNLTDDNWMKHANPVSVWTRYSVLPIIILALWSRTWFGWWSLLFVFLSISWMFLNPILFNKPRSTRNWASRAVLGERVFLNRDNIPLPYHHNTPLHNLLNFLALIGFLTALASAAFYFLWGAIFGVLLAIISKSWFLDRMVWLYEDMKDNNDQYNSWDY